MGCAALQFKLPLVLAAARCRNALRGNPRLNAARYRTANSMRILTNNEFMAPVAMMHRQPKPWPWPWLNF